jgi:hypothetical protein
MTNRMQLGFLALSAAIVVVAALASVDTEASAARPASCRTVATGVCFSNGDQLAVQLDVAAPTITLAMGQDAF